ncbi:solute carrier organic anion transporter family member 5A1-like [Haliotis cracherodii]|uniref:solute carrier organic anion transporter family member 5A1-like n=1 Tax=Haliotis cracherodii TaxID=6455 RepID=UPI0039E73752
MSTVYTVRESWGGPSGLDPQVSFESSNSGYSISSQTQFLKGRTEKDDYIECKLRRDTGSKDKNLSNECGIGTIRPKCLKHCANIKLFVFFMCVLLTIATSLSTGYLNSVITTIEKRFEIGSSISGLIAASYEFGSLVAVIFVSYLGGRRHIPKWIGFGIIFMGIGALLFAMPHIIGPKYTVHNGYDVSNKTDVSICKRPEANKGGYFSTDCIDENSGNWMYVLILVVAQIFIGTGGTPILTLGTTYVDNHVVKEKAPAYLAFIYATGALGPVLGYALGALLLQYYVDTFIYDVGLTTSSPNWIGAWWGGFIICGLLLLLLAIPFLAFPKVLVQEKKKLLELKAKEELLSQEEEEDKEYGKTIKDIPRSMLRLLKNSVYIVVCLGICCEISIVSGFVVFLPKYIETQFGTSTSVANLFTGGIGIPGAVIGILIGGYLIKRLQLQPKGAIQLTLVLNGLALCGFTFFFFLGCDNRKIAGATFPYFNSTGHKIFEANLTSSCNQNCDCSPNHLEPICGINGITYFSPCHAGCTGSNRFYNQDNQYERMFNYSGCSCIMDQDRAQFDHEVIMSPLATSGPCKNTCEKILPFLILLVVMTFCVSGTQMPLLMVTLRSVGEEERAFALGMQFVIMRLFAYIPAPIMFGNAIDTACLLWKQKCRDYGQCLLYDIVQFRYKYVGIGAGLKIMGLLFFTGVWFLLHRRGLAESRTELTVQDIMSSMSSIDKLDLDHRQRLKEPDKVDPEHMTESHDTEPSASDVMVQRDVFTCSTPRESVL